MSSSYPDYLSIGLRTLTAVVGGYLLSAVVALGLSELFQLTGRDAQQFVALVFFTVYAIAIMAVFAFRSTAKALGIPWALTSALWLAWWLATGVTAS
ncbi:hypothetical protein [Marinimicrobium sp. ARAG 43.8]|uniref:hypothetical protein n=1 Tax=Marinimicrobium sp. ARAG 43.8 TaxID=3418719 RepID=UPI003CF99B62